MKIIDCAQYSAEWWAARRGVPTASNFKRIITPKGWAYAETGSQTYINELIAQLYDPQYGMHDQYVSRSMAHGNEMEPEARCYYEFLRGESVREVGFIIDEDSGFGGSPDGIVGEDGGLELKCPDIKTHIKWLRAGGVPDEHLAQCHGYMTIKGCSWWDFLSYCPPLPDLLCRIEPDEKTVKLRGCLQLFWDEYQTALAEIALLKATST